MFGRIELAVLLSCAYSVLAARLTHFGEARMGKISADPDVQKKIESFNTQFTEKGAALDSALAAGSTTVPGDAGNSEGEASFMDSSDSKEPIEEGRNFFELSPQKLLQWKHSLCGSKWPSECADFDSASTMATDGWLCNPSTGKINDIMIYRNDFNGEDEGPGGDEWRFRPRCVSGTCQSTAKGFDKVRIKKISEVGAQVCEWALKTPAEVTVNVNGAKEKVGVRVRASTSEQLEDISLQMNVPLMMLKFPANGKSFKDEAVATDAIRSALGAVGAVETAYAGKVCGHGFTNGASEELQSYPDEFRDLMLARARRVAEVAKAQAGNPHINGFEGVAHLVHADSPCAGLIVKLNGAATEACAEGEWKGVPLSS
mmetsp:Transcript_94863/g.277363  ORF Transcript_94863/g.277363 Transcript_94863/m.277363 type:complete len:372 (-) Transcript_94863:20-1135(-)